MLDLSVSPSLFRKNILQNGDVWLEGKALDIALSEATKDYPDLLRLVDLNNAYKEDLFAEYEVLKESNKQDEEYHTSLKHSIRNLK